MQLGDPSPSESMVRLLRSARFTWITRPSESRTSTELFGPAKLPKEIVARLNKEFIAAMGRPDVQQHGLTVPRDALHPGRQQRL